VRFIHAGIRVQSRVDHDAVDEVIDDCGDGVDAAEALVKCGSTTKGRALNIGHLNAGRWRLVKPKLKGLTLKVVTNPQLMEPKSTGNAYTIIIPWSEEDEAFIATVPELDGCTAHVAFKVSEKGQIEFKADSKAFGVFNGNGLPAFQDSSSN
jgi:hypothetical protein